MKVDRAGGRAEREIELGEERRWERHKEDDEHIGKNGTNSNQVLSNSTCFFSFTVVPFIDLKV